MSTIPPAPLPRVPTSLRRLTSCLLTLALLSIAGCPSFTVRSLEAERSPYHRATVHAYLWNLTRLEPTVVAEACGAAGISTVRAQTNYLYWLIGVLTFGGWVPMGLEWRCADAAPDGSG